MELREMYEPSLMRGRDFKINDKITIHMPSVGDIIDYGEQKYFQLVYLFCSTSSDYKAQLDSVGVDWQKVSDFEMFRQLFIGNKNQDMSILLGDMDTSGFMMAKDNISGEIVLHNRFTDTRIDHVVYETISQYLCAANGIEKHSEFAADEPTRIAMIEEARDNMEYQKTKHYEPHLAELVLSMACSSGFKADYFKAMDYPMSVFMNHVRKIQQIKSYDNTMKANHQLDMVNWEIRLFLFGGFEVVEHISLRLITIVHGQFENQNLKKTGKVLNQELLIRV